PGAAATGRQRLLGRNVLVSVQVAIALVLLTVAFSVYRGFDRDFGNGPGYRTDHLLLMTLDPTLVHYSPDKTKQFFRDLVDGALEVPGVKSAALTTTVPMSLSMLDFAGI